MAPIHEDEIVIVVLDIILDFREIHWDIPQFEGDRPIVDEALERIASSSAVSEAQAEGRAVALPSARELAAARERQLARWAA